jgi:hypothetical protein
VCDGEPALLFQCGLEAVQEPRLSRSNKTGDGHQLARTKGLGGAPIGNHTFRATGITAYLGNGGTLEHAQSMAAHESPCTATLYDRTQDRLTQDEVKRIRL